MCTHQAHPMHTSGTRKIKNFIFFEIFEILPNKFDVPDVCMGCAWCVYITLLGGAHNRKYGPKALIPTPCRTSFYDKNSLLWLSSTSGEKMRFLIRNQIFDPKIDFSKFSSDLKLSHRSEFLSYEAPMVLIRKL